MQHMMASTFRRELQMAMAGSSSSTGTLTLGGSTLPLGAGAEPQAEVPGMPPSGLLPSSAAASPGASRTRGAQAGGRTSEKQNDVSAVATPKQLAKQKQQQQQQAAAERESLLQEKRENQAVSEGERLEPERLVSAQVVQARLAGDEQGRIAAAAEEEGGAMDDQ